MGTWAEIDARPRGAIEPWRVVGGVAPVARLLRQAGRLGWDGGRVVVADEAGAAAVRAAIARDPAPARVAVEVAIAPAGPARPGAIALDGSAIYHRDALAAAAAGGDAPAPLVELREPGDVARARAALHRGVRKSLALDGLISFAVIRPLTRPLVRLLLDTRITPNQVTLAALACGLAAAVAAGFGGATAGALAGLLYWGGGAIDHMDGDLARLRLTSSKLGEWLDSMTDETSTYALCVGLGIGLCRDGRGDGWAALGIGAALAGVAAMAPIYRELHRRRLTIDSAQFPFFFQRGGVETPFAERTATSKLIYLLGFLVRRDVNITTVAVLLAFDLRPIALIAMSIGAAIGLGLTLTHYAVVGLRGRDAPTP